MSITRRLSEPVRAPLRDIVARNSSKFEHLIHAVKNEIVGQLDRVEAKLAELDEKTSVAHESVTDELGFHGATLRNLQLEVERSTVVADAALGEVTEARDEMRALRKEVGEKIAAMAPSVRLQELTGARLADIDAPASAFLNHVQSWNGPLSDAGLFINHPYLVEWAEGEASVRLVNERIIEQPFVFAALADLPMGSRVVDVGGGESIVGLALASLGHKVTVIEPRGYPFSHPNLTVYEGSVESFKPDESLDAVVLLSTIEHLGIGHYADGTADNIEADIEAMAHLRTLTAPGGRLVLTTPYGPAQVTELERIYDRDGLLRLVDGWDIAYTAVGRKIDERGWEVETSELDDPVDSTRVVMLVATRPAA